MNLQQIDQRLHLFKEYLGYVVDFKIARKTPSQTLRIFELTGMLFNGLPAEQIWTFDQWLYQTGHQDLVLYTTNF